MIRFVVSASFLLASAVAVSARPAGNQSTDNNIEAVSGFYVVVLPDGKFGFTAAKTVHLVDGRDLVHTSAGWKMEPPEPSGAPESVKPIDLSVDWRTYIGRRIKVDGRIYGASVDWGVLDLPGSSARINFGGLEHPVLKTLIEQCSGLATGPACRFNVTATVALSTENSMLLIDPLLSAAASR